MTDESEYVCLDHYIDKTLTVFAWSVANTDITYIPRRCDSAAAFHPTRKIEYPWILMRIYERMPKTPNITALDVGGGTSPIGIYMSMIIDHVTVTDISERDSGAMASIMKGKCNNIEFLVDDITKTGLIGKFDIITCISVLEHLQLGDAIKAVENMESLCKPGGFIFITIDVRDDGRDLVDYLNKKYVEPSNADRAIDFLVDDTTRYKVLMYMHTV